MNSDRIDNILLFEQSPEAIEAVKNGNAIVSPGGIKRIGNAGKGFLELAKPAMLSASDLFGMLESKEHALETDSRLKQLDEQWSLSQESLKEIEQVAWLNNAAIQRTYSLTYEGFRQTLFGIECLAEKVSSFESYVQSRDNINLLQEAKTYINYLKSDAGDLRSKKYSVTNGKISEHLDQISAFMSRLLADIDRSDGNAFLPTQLLSNLISPFAYVVCRFSALYYYENDKELMPGNYDEWVDTIKKVSKHERYRENLEYYINLEFTIPFREKAQQSRLLGSKAFKILSSVEFERKYIEDHSRQEYLALSSQINKKIEAKDYYINNHNMVIFLDSPGQTETE